MSGLVRLEKWEDEHSKYVLLGDKDTGGKSYAELIIVLKKEKGTECLSDPSVIAS